MHAERFTELADKFDTFYVTYKKAQAQGKTYLVGTHNLETPYIQAELKKAPKAIQALVKEPKEDRVVLFSYTNNRFRVLEYSQVVWMRMLSTELENSRNGKRRF